MLLWGPLLLCPFPTPDTHPAGSLEGLGPQGKQPSGLCREVAALMLLERHWEIRTRPRNWLVICFSISALLLNPLPLLIKTNTRSLTSRCFCWLNAHCSRCSQGRAGVVYRLGRKREFSPQAAKLCSHYLAQGLDQHTCGSGAPCGAVMTFGSVAPLSPVLVLSHLVPAIPINPCWAV